MKWKNLNELVEDLALESSPSDKEAVIKEIKTQIADYHPDKHNGTFESDEDKERYHSLSDALEYCRDIETDLIPVSAVTAIAEEVAKTMTNVYREPVETNAKMVANELKSNIDSKLKMPKYSTGGVAAISGYLFMAPQTIQNHPYLGDLLNNPLMTALWLDLMFISIAALIILYSVEQRNKKLISKALNSRYHLSLLNDLEIGEFSKNDLKKQLRRGLALHHRPNPFSLIYRKFHDEEFVEDLVYDATEIAIKRYLELDLVKKIGKIGLDDIYEINVNHHMPY